MYQHLEASLHDAFWAAEGDPAELPLLELFLAAYLEEDTRALYLGCGSGRLLLPLLAAGHPIEGLDSSREMLDLCRDHAALHGMEPVLHHQDLAALDVPGPYHAIALPAFTFHLLEDPAAALAAIHRHLSPGGGFYLTTFYPHAELSGELPENEWFLDRKAPLDRGRTAVLHTRHRIKRDERILTRNHRYEITAGNGTVLDTHESTQRLRYFTPNDLRTMLESTGFKLLDVILNLDPDDEDPVDEADTYTLVAVA